MKDKKKDKNAGQKTIDGSDIPDSAAADGSASATTTPHSAVSSKTKRIKKDKTKDKTKDKSKDKSSAGKASAGKKSVTAKSASKSRREAFSCLRYPSVY